MPSKSKAQFGKMGQLYRKGKISRKTLDDFNKGVNPKSLPARITPKKKTKHTSLDSVVKHRKEKYGV